MTDSHSPLPERYANGRFGPGNPGRPVGSYSHASRRAALTILNHFETHGAEMLDRMARDRDHYFKVLARVLPRQIEFGPTDATSWTDAQAAEVFNRARILLDSAGDRRGALADLEALLIGSTSPEAAPVTNGD